MEGKKTSLMSVLLENPFLTRRRIWSQTSHDYITVVIQPKSSQKVNFLTVFWPPKSYQLEVITKVKYAYVLHNVYKVKMFTIRNPPKCKPKISANMTIPEEEGAINIVQFKFLAST